MTLFIYRRLDCPVAWLYP